MPKQKDLKRVVRTRMNKTGESYTAARAQILKKKARRASAADGASGGSRVGATEATSPTTAGSVPVARYAAVAGMSDDAVCNKTGRTWKQWVELLDAAGAAAMPHRDVAGLLHDDHDLPGWWAQMVTVGYERIRGLRDKGQRRDGTFEVNKSKTIGVPLSRLYRAFSNKKERARWLPGVEITARKSVRDKSVRWLWPDGTPVEALFTAKGDNKSQVTVQHRRLAGKAAAAKEAWAERLAALAELLT